MTPQAPDDDRLSGTTRVRAPYPGSTELDTPPFRARTRRGESNEGSRGADRSASTAGHLARLVSVARIASDGRVTSGSLVVLTGVPVLAVYVTGVLTLAVYVTGVLTLAVYVTGVLVLAVIGAGVLVLAVIGAGVLTLAVYVTGVLTLAVIVGVLAHVATMIR